MDLSGISWASRTRDAPENWTWNLSSTKKNLTSYQRISTRVGLARAWFTTHKSSFWMTTTWQLDPNSISRNSERWSKKFAAHKRWFFQPHIMQESRPSCDDVVISIRGKICSDSLENLKSLPLLEIQFEFLETRRRWTTMVHSVWSIIGTKGKSEVIISCFSMLVSGKEIMQLIQQRKLIWSVWTKQEKNLETNFQGNHAMKTVVWKENNAFFWKAF